MTRAGSRGAALLAVAASLAACDAILSIDELPDLASDAGALDAESDSTIDSSTDAGGDRPMPPNDASDVVGDVADDHVVFGPCVHPCVVGESNCTAAAAYQTCVMNDAGCEEYTDPITCAGGAACWGPPRQAYCCSGTTAECAPSCHTPATYSSGDGNGQTSCGRLGTDSCCTALVVDGGTFSRSYDAVDYTDDTSTATVSTFALDKYEVTVGRFRAFLDAVVPTLWIPPTGSGIHTHLNGGMGLVDSSGDGGTFEPGWDSSQNLYVEMSQQAWNTTLACAMASGDDTWTASPGTMESFPINCVTWQAAYAFCIWDGGFLPSEAEWNYAASGGSQQRHFAWSNPSTSPLVDCTYADYDGPCTAGGPTIVGVDPNGNGLFGQSDLTGNVFEWTYDYYAAYTTPCIDCAFATNVAFTPGRTLRGADWTYAASRLDVSTRYYEPDVTTYADNGFRCARSP
jgi:sulfatase modifying factor 1